MGIIIFTLFLLLTYFGLSVVIGFLKIHEFFEEKLQMPWILAVTFSFLLLPLTPIIFTYCFIKELIVYLIDLVSKLTEEEIL